MRLMGPRLYFVVVPHWHVEGAGDEFAGVAASIFGSSLRFARPCAPGIEYAMSSARGLLR